MQRLRHRPIGNGTMHGSGNAPMTGSSVAFALSSGDGLGKDRGYRDLGLGLGFRDYGLENKIRS